MDDETQIRELIDAWFAAVRAGDLDVVLADHADDIVMYDVPPPLAGNQGIDEYRASWPQFFEWLAAGAAFELESLHVVASGEVAFAYGLVRCGTADDFSRRPDMRMRLTVGLQKRSARWTVVHEHHSFPHTDGAPVADS